MSSLSKFLFFQLAGAIFYFAIVLFAGFKDVGILFSVGIILAILGLTGIIITIPSLTKGILLEFKGSKFKRLFYTELVLGILFILANFLFA